MNTIYCTVDKIMFSKIKHCKTVNEIWEKFEMICEGTDRIKENKLMIVVRKFENFKMKAASSAEKFDSSDSDDEAILFYLLLFVIE